MKHPSPIETLASLAKNTTELELAKAFLKSGVTASSAIDKSASWLLAGIGATTALIISNLDKTVPFIGNSAVRTLLLLLIVAGLFGILQKYMALLVQVQLHVEKEIEESMSTILESHEKQEENIAKLRGQNDPEVDTSIDFTKPLNEIANVVPWYQRWSFRRRTKDAKSDPLSGRKHAAMLFNRQGMYATGQLVTAVIAILVIAGSI